MRVHLAPEIRTHLLKVRHIGRKPSRAMLHRHVGDVEHAPGTGNDGGHALVPDFGLAARHFHAAADRGIEQFEPTADDIVAPIGLDGAHIGAVDPGELALRIAQPGWCRRRIEHCAQAVTLADGIRESLAQACQFEPVARHIADPHHGAAGDGAALGFEITSFECDEGQAERLATVAQAFDGAFQLLRDHRRQP